MYQLLMKGFVQRLRILTVIRTQDLCTRKSRILCWLLLIFETFHALLAVCIKKISCLNHAWKSCIQLFTWVDQYTRSIFNHTSYGITLCNVLSKYARKFKVKASFIWCQEIVGSTVKQPLLETPDEVFFFNSKSFFPHLMIFMSRWFKWSLGWLNFQWRI